MDNYCHLGLTDDFFKPTPRTLILRLSTQYLNMQALVLLNMIVHHCDTN